jgi:hypothetical protein
MALALPSDLEISCDPSRIDVSLVHEFLRTSYWALGRSRETVERSIRHSPIRISRACERFPWGLAMLMASMHCLASSRSANQNG